VIDGATNQVIATIPVGDYPRAFPREKFGLIYLIDKKKNFCYIIGMKLKRR
jgi:DNA-binding beta-propeller fold protein YncE